MAKNTKTQQKQQNRPSNMTDIKKLIKQNEFAIGAGTVVVLAVITFLVMNGFSSGIKLSNLFGKSNSVKMVDTKMQSEQASTPSASMMPKQEDKMGQASESGSMKQINKLSNTSSMDFITVARGDSYGRIAKRYCGNGRIYMLLSELNKNVDLHPGDKVKVSCDF